MAQPVAIRWPAATGRMLGLPLAALEGARGHLMPFAPVLLGIGIGLYFALPSEPAPTTLLALGCAALALCGIGLSGPEPWRLPAMAAALLAAGVALGGLRSALVAAPVLDDPYTGVIDGRVIMVDRSARYAMRLTLDRIVLTGIAATDTPRRVRISLHGPLPETEPIPGTRISVFGHLGPPNGPAEPGGFDFRRLAWFERLGAVGYSRKALTERALPPADWSLAITRLRMRLSESLRRRMPGEAGGFVAAVLTGDRSGVGLATTEALRGSNLAHLLAISGLHMGLLTGVVFGAVRGGLALSAPLALRLPIRKIAAAVALLAAAFYLALSGGNVATERAFIMAAVMLGAILADRRAMSIRSVALAALLVLAWQPEALLTPGFQMSFAATLALVAVFAHLRDAPRDPAAPQPRRRPRVPGWLRHCQTLILCSLVAGLATAPIAAAQFHRLAEYGLLANLLSVPLMGALIMPAAVVAAVLWPIGLEGAALWLMQLGAAWILEVARWVAGIDGAIRPVVAPSDWVIPTLALGALWLILWPGRARWAGLLPMTFAMLLWDQAPRPTILIARDGALVGVLGPQGRALSRPAGAGYTARAWLAADGDMADQRTAASLPTVQRVRGGAAFDLPDGRLVHLWGRGAIDAVSTHCAPRTTIVLAARWVGAPLQDCRIYDLSELSQSGALSFSIDRGWLSTAQITGRRPWALAQGPDIPG